MTMRAMGGGAGGITSSTISKITTGTATPTANGVGSVFSFAHGVGTTPVFVSVTSKTVLGAVDFSTAWDGTNITVTYAISPGAGTLSFSWIAFS